MTACTWLRSSFFLVYSLQPSTQHLKFTLSPTGANEGLVKAYCLGESLCTLGECPFVARGLHTYYRACPRPSLPLYVTPFTPARLK